MKNQRPPSRRTLLKVLAGLSALLPAGVCAENKREFFAMDTAMVPRYGTPLTKSDIEVAARLGYSGVAPEVSATQSWEHIVRKVLPWLDEYHLKLVAIYTSVEAGRSNFVIDPGIRENLPALRKSGATIWLPVTSLREAKNVLQPSDLAGDEMAARAVTQVADDAAEYGCSVALYPHFGNLIQRVEDAVRICERVNRKNLGLTFNLCHYLHTEPEVPLRQALKVARPHLSLVTICGADKDGKSWDKLIQPLDRGTFRTQLLLDKLKHVGYKGPIGLQGYQVAETFKIAPQENLRRSMTAWKQLTHG